MNEEFEQDIAISIKYELEIVEAITKGHKASWDDKFKRHREELARLRKKLNIPNHAEQKYNKK